MAYGLPVKGQANYDDELNNSIEAVKSQAELAQSTADGANTSANAAKTDATNAVATANQALDFVRTTSDDRVAEHVNDSTSATRAALSATYGAAATHLAAGTLAARPAANTVPAGTLYPATDNGITYRSDGTNWAVWRDDSPVAFEVADGTGATNFHTFPATTFAVVNYSTVVTNVGGGVWDGTNKTWQVPVTGAYLCVARIRLADSTTDRGFGQGVHTATSDGTWFVWGSRGGFTRSGMPYTRVAKFNAGDLLRHFGYNDGAAVDITAASFTATLLART